MRIIYPDGLLLIAYAPIGVVLLMLRIFIFLHAQFVSCVLSQLPIVRRLVLRVMSTVLGFIISVDSSQRDVRNDFAAIVSNHATLFDHLVLSVLEECISPCQRVFRWRSNIFGKEPYSAADLARNCVENGTRCIHLLPEKAPTGLSDCVLGFDQKVFASFETVQPVALKVSRPYPIKLVSHPINWITELLWQFFTPFTCYHVRYLTPVNRIPNESDRDFSSRVRSVIASGLNASLSPLNAEHLADFTPSGSQRSSLSFENLGSTASVSPNSSGLSTRCSSGSSFDINMHASLDELRRRRVSRELASPPQSLVEFPFNHLIPRITDILGKNIPISRIRKALTITQGDVESSVDFLLDDSQNESFREETPTRTQNVNSLSRLNMSSKEFFPNSSSRQNDLNQRRAALLSRARELFLSKQSSSA